MATAIAKRPHTTVVFFTDLPSKKVATSYSYSDLCKGKGAGDKKVAFLYIFHMMHLQKDKGRLGK